MSPQLTKKLNQLIAKNELEEAIRLLQNEDEGVPKAIREELILLSGRLQKLKQEEFRGVISHEHALLEINRIRSALSQIAQTYSKTPEELARIALRNKLRWAIPSLIYLLVAGGTLWWFFQPQPNFRLEAELLVERLTFKFLEGPGNFMRGNIHSCYWQNYQSMSIEADRVVLDTGSREAIVPTSVVLFKADENVPGIGVRFGAAILEQLQIEPGALLTLIHDEEMLSNLRLSIQQTTGLSSEWTYQDSLDLEVEMASQEGLPGATTFYGPTSLRFFPPPGKAREIKVRSFSGTTNLELQFDAGYQIEGKNLLIADPNFYQPLESVAVPTLLGGNIQIGALDKKPLKNITISEGEALDLFSEQHYNLQKITFGEIGIHIHFYGEVQGVETGRDHESRNPLRIEWWWHSRKLLVVAMGIIGLAFFPLIRLWK